MTSLGSRELREMATHAHYDSKYKLVADANFAHVYVCAMNECLSWAGHAWAEGPGSAGG